MKNKTNTLTEGQTATHGISEMTQRFPDLQNIPWDQRYYSEDEFYRMVTNYTSVTSEEINRWLNGRWGFRWTVNVME